MESDLHSTCAATNFSFASVEVGIPFATSENALTIFNCSAAKRYVYLYHFIHHPDLVLLFLSCVDCLDTEGACGWCLYGGTCSGVSEVCPTPEGVNNSYLTVNPQPCVENNSYQPSSQLDSSSGPTEVCPVVNEASTPSGNYTQPVNVARDLVLQTSNLPLPVS